MGLLFAYSVLHMCLPSVDSSGGVVALVKVPWLTHKLYRSGQSNSIIKSLLWFFPPFQPLNGCLLCLSVLFLKYAVTVF